MNNSNLESDHSVPPVINLDSDQPVPPIMSPQLPILSPQTTSPRDPRNSRQHPEDDHLRFRRDHEEMKNEYLRSIPVFSGEPLLLSRFIRVCDRVYDNFYDHTNPDSVRNHYITDTIFGKISGKAVEVVFSNNAEDYPTLRTVLLENFADTRDFFTLVGELSKMTQRASETCFEFHQRVIVQVNAMIAYLQVNKAQPEQGVLIQFTRDYALRVFTNGLVEATAALLRARKCDSLNEALLVLRNEFNFSNKHQVSNSPKPFNSSVKNISQTPRFNSSSQSKPSNFQAPTFFRNPPNTNWYNQYKPQGMWRPQYNSGSNQDMNQGQSPSRPPFQRSFSNQQQGKSNQHQLQRQSSNQLQRQSSNQAMNRNFHLMENDPDAQLEQPSEEQFHTPQYMPGYFDGSCFFPVEIVPNFENLSIQESPQAEAQAAEEQSTAVFLEHPQES